MESREIVTEFWRRIEARDWDAVRALLAEDLVCEWPHSRERIRGAENWLAVNRDFPEGWSIELQEVIADGTHAVSYARVPHPDLGTSHAASFFELDETGKILRMTELWVDEGRQAKSPHDRSRWVERS